MAKYEIKDGVGIIPEGITVIENNAFEGEKDLKSIVIPASVTRIGNIAFKDCDLDLVVWTEEGSYAWIYCEEEIIDVLPWDGSKAPKDEDDEDEDDTEEEEIDLFGSP